MFGSFRGFLIFGRSPVDALQACVARRVPLKINLLIWTKKTYFKECLLAVYGQLRKKNWMGGGNSSEFPDALISEICQFWLGWFEGCPREGEGDIIIVY